MTIQHITVFGLEGLESRELEEMLSSVTYVEEIQVRLSQDRIQPGAIYASAEYVEFILKFLAKEVAEALGKEAAKVVVSETWKLIKQRVTDWKMERNRETGRERIHLAFGRDGELLVEEQIEERSGTNRVD